MAGVVLVADGFDDGEDGGSFFGGHAGDGFEGVAQLALWGPSVVAEDEAVEGNAEDDGEAGEDVEGGLAGSGLVAAFLGDVDTDLIGEGLLGEPSLFAELDESLGEVHAGLDPRRRGHLLTGMPTYSRSNREESLDRLGDGMAGDGWDVSDVELLERVVAHYRRALDEGARAQDWLAERSITSEAVEAFGLGWSDRTLGLALPSHDRVAGRELRGRLQALGVLRSTGHEQFRGCVTVPVRNADGQVVQVCGLRLDRPQRRGDRPSTPTGEVLWAGLSATALWHPEATAAGEVVVAGSLLDGLVWWSAGHQHVLAPGGPDGWPDDLAERLHAGGVTRALLAMARTDEGDADAATLAADLAAVGIECFRVVFPRGGDAVMVAAEADVASDALAELLREATWLAAPATSTTAPSSPRDGVDREHPSVSPVPPAPRADGFEVEGGELRAVIEDRHWRVRGLDRITGAGSLRVNLSVRTQDGEQFHLDVLDLYAARARQAFIATAAGELAVEEDVLRQELGRVLMACEDRLVELGDATPHPMAPVLTTEEEAAALDLLRDPSLIDRIVADIAVLGLVGEAHNALVAYLAATSRLLESTLAVVVQSGSAAGKSTLTDAVLSLTPPEQRLSVSAMTGQSLFYLGETELAHKILSIAEAEGAARAAYPLKLLQSDGELSIASTGKDPTTGGLVTRTYRSRGPVALFLTTTAPALADELANRCIVLGVDEDHAQDPGDPRRPTRRTDPRRPPGPPRTRPRPGVARQRPTAPGARRGGEPARPDPRLRRWPHQSAPGPGQAPHPDPGCRAAAPAPAATAPGGAPRGRSHLHRSQRRRRCCRRTVGTAHLQLERGRAGAAVPAAARPARRPRRQGDGRRRV